MNTVGLDTIAELSLALAGFSALLAVIHGGPMSAWSPRTRYAFELILSNSLAAFGFCFLPTLLHGLGFAGALAERGLQEDELFASLLGFNLGVELGQITVAAVAYPLLHKIVPEALWEARVRPALLVGLAAIGLYWTVERLL